MYLTLNELVEKIQNNIERLQAGRMELDEVEAHLDLVREMHERTIILKYKALEAKALRNEAVTETPANVPVEERIEPVHEVTSVVEETINETKEEEVQGFDLFGSMFATEEPKHDEQPATAVEEPVSTPKPVVEEMHVEEPVAAIEEEVPATVEVETERDDEFVPVEANVAPVVETVTSNKHLAAFSQRLVEVNAEVSNQFGFSPLHTLIGSFGLNERLLYINELFGGSSEAFSEAVKDFDGLADLNQASQKVLQYADQNMWDVESSTVTEFMQKLCRRYA